MNTIIRQLLFVSLLLIIGSASQALAQDWPNRTIRIVVPYVAGAALACWAR